MSKKVSYHAQVDYNLADPAKILAQKEARATSKNMPFGFKEVKASRGESAYVFDMGAMYGAFVQEGLGTKSLIAQEVYQKTGRSHFAAIAQDTVATIINDLITVGATPLVVNAYWSSSSYKWLADKKLASDFIMGWRLACNKSGVVWGGGETQSLPGIIKNGALEFAGSGFGVVKPKKQLLTENNLRSGDAILLLESSGVHANGISLIRKIAQNLKAGYQTKLANGLTLGGVILEPSHIYSPIIRDFFKQGLKVHYLSNITGHGWRKIMRANRAFTYRLNNVPQPLEIFNFIAGASKNNETEMYENYNMGAGYCAFLPLRDAGVAQKIAKKHGLNSWLAGYVEAGPKRVVIGPKNIVFEAESLNIR